MNKKEIINAIAEKMEITKKDATQALETFVEVVTDALVKGDEVKITGFGTFSITERPERQGRNPQTGEAITLPSSKAPKFKASSVLKTAVNA